jgi:hypothetical protein
MGGTLGMSSTSPTPGAGDDEFAGTLRELGEQLRSRNVEERDRAAAETAMLLELHFRPIEPVNHPSYYVDVIREGLLGRPLKDGEELDLVALLREAFLSSDHDAPGGGASLLFAMSKAKPWIVAGHFVELLIDRLESLNEDELHQLVHGLEQFLWLEHDHPGFQRLMGELRRPGVRSAIARVGAKPATSVNSCMTEDAARILQRLPE